MYVLFDKLLYFNNIYRVAIQNCFLDLTEEMKGGDNYQMAVAIIPVIFFNLMNEFVTKLDGVDSLYVDGTEQKYMVTANM